MMRHLRLTTLVALFVVISAVAVAAAPFAYIANSGNGSVSVIDLSTTPNTVISPALTVGQSPFGVAISRDGSRVYISNFFSSTVSIINPANIGTPNNPVIATIPLPGFSLPYGLDVNADGTRLYVARSANGNVGVHDTTTAPYSQVAVISVGSVPRGVAVTPDGSRLIVATRFGTWYASVVDLVPTSPTFHQVIGTLPGGNGGHGVAVSPDGSKAYVSRDSGIVSIIDLTNNTEAGTVFVGTLPVGLAVNAAGSRLYVANSGSDNVSVIDTSIASPAEIAQIVVGDNPQGVSLNAAGDRLYVVNRGTGAAPGTVSVVNTGTNAVVETLTVGSMPMGLGSFIHHPSVQYTLTWVRPTNGSTTGVNAGSTVPVHWSMTDANGTAISDLAVVTGITSAPCASGSSTAAASARIRASSAGSSHLRYNTDNFQFNWKTDKAWAGSCRQLIVQLNDGSSHFLTFQFR